MSLPDDVVHNFVISHSYSSTCLSKSATGEKGRITYRRLYLRIHSARSIVCILASTSLYQASRLTYVCIPACVRALVWRLQNVDCCSKETLRKFLDLNLTTAQYQLTEKSVSFSPESSEYCNILTVTIRGLIKRIREATSQRKRFSEVVHRTTY